MKVGRCEVTIQTGVGRSSDWLGGDRDGYVKMAHGQQYGICMSTDYHKRVDAELFIDGEHVDTFVLGYGRTCFERPSSSNKRFTFFRGGTQEARAAALHEVSAQNLGLIRVKFKPQLVYHDTPNWSPVSSTLEFNQPKGLGGGGGGTYSASYTRGRGGSSGGTGLSGHSNQSYYAVGTVIYDVHDITTVNLRLVWDASSDIEPLHKRENRVPPPTF